MSEQLTEHTIETVDESASQETPQDQVGRVTLLHALAEVTDAIAPNRSNQSTRFSGNADPDDQ